VPPYKEVITVPAQVPDVIVPIEFKLEAVVNEAKDATLVATKVIFPVGKVAFVVADVVKVRLLAPEVISEEPSTIVKVDDVVGAVTVTLFKVDVVTALFNKTTPEIEEALLVEVNKLPPIPTPPVTTNAPEFVLILALVLVIFVVPPIKALPVIPNPPNTDSAAAVVELAFNPEVTANPDKLTNPVLGLITKVDIVDSPNPVPEAELTAVIENCELTTVGATATEEAAEGGTDCQVGTELDPVEVNTYPEFELAANLAKDVPVEATNKSPTE
jgi:hypothetical protein